MKEWDFQLNDEKLALYWADIVVELKENGTYTILKNRHSFKGVMAGRVYGIQPEKIRNIILRQTFCECKVEDLEGVDLNELFGEVEDIEEVMNEVLE